MTEPQVAPALAQPQTNFVFPQEIEVTLTFKIGVTTQEQRDYYLDAKTGAITVNFLADSFDQFFAVESEVLLAVNGLYEKDAQKLLQAQTTQSVQP